jgi:protein phosphatase
MVRATNEDSYDVLPHLGLYMVADGMGGAAAGEIASQTVIDEVRWAVEDGETTWPIDPAIKGPESSPRRLLAGIHRANDRIQGMVRKDRRKAGMGTTFAGMLALTRCVVIAHVGDSRVYRLRAGRLELMTSDHSLVNELVQLGRLTAEEARTFPRRNLITRAVGPHADVEVDVKIVDVRPGDAFLLCTDGLHGKLEDDEVEAILVANDDPCAAADLLIERANEAGGDDNITAVVVRWEEDDAEERDDDL